MHSSLKIANIVLGELKSIRFALRQASTGCNLRVTRRWRTEIKYGLDVWVGGLFAQLLNHVMSTDCSQLTLMQIVTLIYSASHVKKATKLTQAHEEWTAIAIATPPQTHQNKGTKKKKIQDADADADSWLPLLLLCFGVSFFAWPLCFTISISVLLFFTHTHTHTRTDTHNHIEMDANVNVPAIQTNRALCPLPVLSRTLSTSTLNDRPIQTETTLRKCQQSWEHFAGSCAIPTTM